MTKLSPIFALFFHFDMKNAQNLKNELVKLVKKQILKCHYLIHIQILKHNGNHLTVFELEDYEIETFF